MITGTSIVSKQASGVDVEIRPSTPNDLEAFWHCVDSVARERRFLAMVEAPPLSEARAYLEQARSQGMIQFVALKEPRIVGWCDVVPIRWEGFRHSGRLGMGVSGDFRGRGIGTRLLGETLRAARAAGLRRIELEVFGSNRVARAMYERHGFVQEGVKRRGRVLDGGVDDLICMALAFETNA